MTAVRSVVARAILTALAGSSKTAFAFVLIGASLNTFYILAVGLAILTVYLVDRAEDVKDKNSVGTVLKSAGLCGLGAIAVSFGCGGLPGVALPLLVGLIYGKALKGLPGLKLPIIAFCWAWACGAWPGVMTGWGAAELFTYTFALVAIDSAFCDLRDVEDDRKAGLMTLPILARGRTAGMLLLACVCLAAWTISVLPMVALLPVLGLAGVIAWHSDGRNLNKVESRLDGIDVLPALVVILKIVRA